MQTSRHQSAEILDQRRRLENADGGLLSCRIASGPSDYPEVHSQPFSYLEFPTGALARLLARPQGFESKHNERKDRKEPERGKISALCILPEGLKRSTQITMNRVSLEARSQARRRTQLNDAHAAAKPGAALPPVTGDSPKNPPNIVPEKPHLNTARARSYGSPMKRINLVIMPDKLAGTPKTRARDRLHPSPRPRRPV
jgi:hypothetical protein